MIKEVKVEGEEIKKAELGYFNLGVLYTDAGNLYVFDVKMVTLIHKLSGMIPRSVTTLHMINGTIYYLAN